MKKSLIIILSVLNINQSYAVRTSGEDLEFSSSSPLALRGFSPDLSELGALEDQDLLYPKMVQKDHLEDMKLLLNRFYTLSSEWKKRKLKHSTDFFQSIKKSRGKFYAPLRCLHRFLEQDWVREFYIGEFRKSEPKYNEASFQHSHNGISYLIRYLNKLKKK